MSWLALIARHLVGLFSGSRLVLSLGGLMGQLGLKLREGEREIATSKMLVRTAEYAELNNRLGASNINFIRGLIYG